MRSILHKLLTCTLLVAYAGVMLLGEGLHSLVPGHDHHHGSNIVTCDAHDNGHSHSHGGHCCDHHPHGPCCHHKADHDHVPPGPTIADRDGDMHTHACDICAFLFQAVSQPPQVATTPDLHPLVADAPCNPTHRYASAILGLHAARGPPQFFV